MSKPSKSWRNLMAAVKPWPAGEPMKVATGLIEAFEKSNPLPDHVCYRLIETARELEAKRTTSIKPAALVMAAANRPAPVSPKGGMTMLNPTAKHDRFRCDPALSRVDNIRGAAVQFLMNAVLADGPRPTEQLVDVGAAVLTMMAETEFAPGWGLNDPRLLAFCQTGMPDLTMTELRQVLTPNAKPATVLHLQERRDG
jgi:hypothetical protein